MHIHQKLTFVLLLAGAAISLTTGGKLAKPVPPATTMSSVQDDPSFDAIRNTFSNLLASGGQYMVVPQCVDVDPTNPALRPVLKPYLEHPSAANLKLRDCKYTSAGLSGRVLMVNADADQLARWTISACKATNQKTRPLCLTAVVNDLWCPSNAQFPIAGTVVEPAENCGKGLGSALIAFRDGVTVRLKSFGSTCVKQQLTPDQLASVLAEPPVKSAFFARIANAHRDLIRASGVPQAKLGRLPVNGEIPYLKTVREAYLDAFGRDDYSFLSVWAAANEKSGFFERFKNLPLGKAKCNCFYAKTPAQIHNRCKL